MPEAVTMSGRGEAVHLNGVRISPQVMAVLEATPLMGRLLEPREEASGLDRVAVISYAMWQRRFGGADGFLKNDRARRHNARSASCVPAFSFERRRGGLDSFVWDPATATCVVGRLAAGASFLTASTEVNDLMRLRRRSAAPLVGRRRSVPSSPGAAPRPASSAGPPPPDHVASAAASARTRCRAATATPSGTRPGAGPHGADLAAVDRRPACTVT
jgi:hypothetical protein